MRAKTLGISIEAKQRRDAENKEYVLTLKVEFARYRRADGSSWSTDNLYDTTRLGGKDGRS